MNQKPPIGAQIDWSHPLAQGLVGCWLLNEMAGVTVHNIANAPFQSSAAIGVVGWTPSGVQFNNSSLSGGISVGKPYVFGGVKPICVFQKFIKLDTVARPTFSQYVEIVLRGASGGGYEFVLNSFSTNDRCSGGTTVANKPVCVVGMYDGYALSVWQDGKMVGSTIPTGAYANDVNGWVIGGNNSIGTAVNSIIEVTYVFSRALSAAEIVSLSENPYQMILTSNPQFAPRSKNINYNQVRYW